MGWLVRGTLARMPIRPEPHVHAVVDWRRQKSDFEPDGSLRDIYVQGTTLEDWRVVFPLIVDGNFQARLERSGAVVAVPSAFESLFDGNDRYLLTFSIGGVGLDCHFFGPEEIEFSFAPNSVTENALQGLLQFMVDIGDVTKKRVVMSPENGPAVPIFSYEPNESDLRWIPPIDRRL